MTAIVRCFCNPQCTQSSTKRHKVTLYAIFAKPFANSTGDTQWHNAHDKLLAFFFSFAREHFAQLTVNCGNARIFHLFSAHVICVFARPKTEYSHCGHCVHAIKTFGIRKFAHRIVCLCVRWLFVHVAAGPNKLLPFRLNRTFSVLDQIELMRHNDDGQKREKKRYK